MKKLFAILAIAFCSTAMAWQPTKPINVYIGFAPGSGNELSFRGVSSIMERQNKNLSFVIRNQPGADGVIAMNEFITKPNDGYHVYVPSHQGIWVTAEYFNKQAVRYTLDDFEYVVSIAKSPLAIVVPGDSNIKTVPEFLKAIQNPEKSLNIAAGSGAHKLAYNYMSDKLNLDEKKVQLIGYKGPAQAAVAVAAKEVDYGILPVAVAQTIAQSGKIRILAICGEKRLAQIPDVPLMNQFVPGMNVYAAWGIILPKGTPKEIVDWYVTNFSTTIVSKEAQQFFDNNLMFIDERELTPQGFKNSMMQLRKQWIPVISKLNIQ
jgi:tripartite-type tricarboxylate transporter receptor subunit TctC